MKKYKCESCGRTSAQKFCNDPYCSPNCREKDYASGLGKIAVQEEASENLKYECEYCGRTFAQKFCNDPYCSPNCREKDYGHE